MPRAPNQPHWNTATVTPTLAASESRKPTAAFSGTTSERNTAISSSTERPTTTSTNGSRALPRRVEMSICTAVVPVTEIGIL